MDSSSAFSFFLKKEPSLSSPSSSSYAAFCSYLAAFLALASALKRSALSYLVSLGLLGSASVAASDADILGNTVT